VGYGIAIKELGHGYTDLECNQFVGGYLSEPTFTTKINIGLESE
jgi:hypothetical protein